MDNKLRILLRKQNVFYALTGLNEKQFFFIMSHMRKKLYITGRKHETSPETILFYYFVYIRHYFSFELMSVLLYGKHASTISRNFSLIRKNIKHISLPFINKQNNISAASVSCIIRDATEQRCIRSSNKTIQKLAYSGKKKAHTIKTEIIVSKERKILSVSHSVFGSKHDKKLADEHPLPPEMNGNVTQQVDKGYMGFNGNLEIPFKRSKSNPLTDSKKIFNQILSRERTPVEHQFAHLKNYKAFSVQRKDLNLERYNQEFQLMAGLQNMR